MSFSSKKILSTSALLFATFTTFSAYANAPSSGISAKFSIENNQKNICQSRADFDLNIKSIDNHDIILNNIEALKLADNLSGKKRDSRISFSKENLKSIRHLNAEQERNFKISLDNPKKDGFYKDAIKLHWEYKDGRGNGTIKPNTLNSESILYYRVQDGCISLVDSKTYEDATTTYEISNVFENGERKTVKESVGAVSKNDGDKLNFENAETIFEVTSDNVFLFNDSKEVENADPSALNSTLDLNFCVRVSYLDNFTSCPSDTTGMEWTQPYCDQASVNMQGLIVSLYDRDGEDSADDDFIGNYTLNYNSRTGYTCMNFEWNQSERGEDYPEVYIKTHYTVKDPNSSGVNAYLCDDNDSLSDECDDDHKYTVTWRPSYISNMSSTEYLSMLFNSDETSSANQRGMQMATMQKFLYAFESYNMTGALNGWWEGDKCTTSDGDPWPCSYDDNWLTLTEGNYREWDTGPHEAGHCYQKQLFEQSSLYGSSCPSPHYLDGVSNDACATREGFAEFISFISWYSEPDSATSPTFWGYNIESGASVASSCSNNSKTELQVAKTLWDVIDDNVDGDDSYDGSRQYVAYTLDLFENGTNNNKDKEGGDDGVNLWDMHANGGWSSSFKTGLNNAMKQNDTNCQSND